MICPFRSDIDFDYEIRNSQVVENAQHMKYPECYGEECPFYDTDKMFGCKCKRVDAMTICEDDMEE